MSDRNRTRRRWRRRRTAENYDTFRHLRNQVQVLVRAAKAKYYQEAFRNITELNTAWKHLRPLGLVKPRSSGGKLVFFLEEVNGFFCDVGAAIGNPLADSIPIHLGETIYDDSKFYWKNIEPVHIINTLMRCKYRSIGVDCTGTPGEDPALYFTCSDIHF